MKTPSIESPSMGRKPRDESQIESTDSSWKLLYRVGAAGALIAAGLEIAAALISVISSSSSGPPPSTVIDYFMLLQHNRFLGLVDLGLFDIAALTFLVPMFLAVYIALRRASASLMAIATTLSLVGIAVYLATETAFSMLSLSNQYAAATTDAQRALFEAAGQAMLAEQVGTGTGSYMGFFLLSVAGLLIATVMLRSDLFSKVTATVGIVANGFLFVYYIGLAFVSIPPAIGVPIYWASGLLSLMWFILIGLRLFKLAQGESRDVTKQPAIGAESTRRRAFFMWAALLSLVCSILFFGVTALTIGLWVAHQNALTTPVSDLSFFALGAIIVGMGFVVQLRDPERKIAGVQQAVLGLLALLLAGLIGNRIEPLVGALIFLGAAAILVVLHPARRECFKLGQGLSTPLAAMSLLASVPAVVYVASMLVLARHAGPSCFFGRCPYGDRLAEMAALAIAIVLVGLLAALKTSGWRVAAWSAGVSAVILGVASIVLPDAPGTLGQAWGALTATWGVLFVVVAEWEARQKWPSTGQVQEVKTLASSERR